MAENLIKWKTLPEEAKIIRKRLFGPDANQHNDVISVPYGIVSRPKMAEVIEKIKNFKLRSDDIWIVTYPKCGTTLTQVKKFQFHADFGNLRGGTNF